MARLVSIVLEVDDRGSAKVRKFSGELGRAAQTGAAQASSAFAAAEVSIAGSLDRMTSRMLRWGGLAATVFGAIAARQVLRFGADFGRAMSEVRAFTGATETQFQSLEGTARELGRTTVFTAVQSAEAMRNLSLAGFKTAEILEVVPDVLNLAAAGSIEMSEAASITSDVMRGMGIEANELTRAVDVLAFTASNSNQVLSDLGNAFKYAATTARAIGADFEEVNGALGILANRGIRADMAGTALRRTFSIMLGDLEEGEKGLGEFNVQLFDSEGRFVGLAEALRRLQGAGFNAADAMSVFGQRAGPAVLALLQAGPDALDEFTRSLEGAGGTAENVATTKLDNLWGQMKLLASASQELALSFFEKVEPSLRAAAKGATDLINAWSGSIRATDVLSGLSRAANAAALAFAVLAVNAGVKWVAAARAGFLATVQLATGFSALDMQLLRSQTLLETVAVSSTRARVAMAGLAAGIGFLAYQATRAVLEITGLDAKIQEFITANQDAQDSAVSAFGELEDNLRAVERGIAAFGRQGIEIDVDTRLLEQARGILSQAFDPEIGQEAFQSLAEGTEALQERFKGLRDVIFGASRAMMQDADAWAQAWESAGAKGANGLDRLRLALEAIRSASGGTGEAPPPPAPDLDTSKFDAAKKDLEKGLLEIGFLSQAMADTFGASFADVGKAADAASVPLDRVAAAFREDLVKIGDAATASGAVLSPFLADLVDRARALEGMRGIDELVASLGDPPEVAAWEALEGALTRVGIATQGMLEGFGASWRDTLRAASANGVGFEDAVRANAETLLSWGDAAARGGLVVDAELRRAIERARELNAEEIRTDAWDGLRFRLLDVGVVSQDAARIISEDLATAVEAAAEHGIAAGDVYRGLRDEVYRTVEAFVLAGEAIPESLAQAYDDARAGEFIEELRGSAFEFVSEIGSAWGDFVQGAIGSFSTLVGQVVTGQVSLAEGFKNLLRQGASQAIALLAQWGIQRLIVGKLTTTATAKEHAAQLSGSLAAVFANAFASTAAIPIIGPALAPIVAAGSLAAATAGAAGAGAAGAALGASLGSIPGAAEGGLVKQPQVVSVGEFGRPEAIVPLEGTAAKRVKRALGLEEGAGSSPISVTLNQNGPVLSDRVPQDFVERVAESLADMIRSGRLAAFPTAARS